MSTRTKRIRLGPRANTQVTTIEKLCGDVLVEIFSYLSAAELRSASLVCKHWNEVIGSSSVAMKKFKLKLKESDLIGRPFRSTRNYQNIELKMLTTRNPTSDQKALENLGRFFALSQVKIFKILASDPEVVIHLITFDHPRRTFSIDAMKLTSALKQMKLLEELFIDCPTGFRGSFTSTVQLPKLTKLAVKSPDMSIFQWLSASNVTEINLGTQSKSIGSVQHLASFLKLCKQITTLKFNSSLVEELFGNGKWKDFNLKLSHLDIKVNRNASLDASSFREFVISQAETLTYFAMMDDDSPWSGPVPQSAFESFGRLKNLKILNLDCKEIPDITFLRQLTELEQLTLYTANDISSIARFNRKLTYLRIYSVQSSLDAGLEFGELRRLHLGLDDSSNYLKVVTSSPKVQVIELKLTMSYDSDGGESYEEGIRAALQQPIMKHLILVYWSNNNDGDIRPLEEAFDMLSSDYGNLQSLNLAAKAGREWKSVKFLLPGNRSEWNADEQKMRFDEIFH